MRLHLGHRDDLLNMKLTPYLYGTRHNINIYNLEKFWKPYRYLFYSLALTFSKRNSFFIVGTNKNLPMHILLEKLVHKYPLEMSPNFSFYVSGYVDRKWIGGLFSNWKIFNEFIQYLHNPFFKFKKRYKFQKYFFYLKGIKNLMHMPIPDFVVFLDYDADAHFELKKFQIPLIALVDTNLDPDQYLYKFFGNNDSIENIEFFFEFLTETLKEGRFKEQQQFYAYFMYKVKKNLYRQIKL